MNIGFLVISFIAGVLTILAPCALPLLPVIVGGSLTDQNKSRPIIITLSLALSIVLFTLLLKASTVFIDIPQEFWKWFSAGIIFIFALSLLFPDFFARLQLGIKKLFPKKKEHSDQVSISQKLLFKFYDQKGFWPAVILGLALGPVFASCSPTYFVILGTVLPANFLVGVLNLLVYALGLAFVMLLVAYTGQRIMGTLNIASNPKGWFKRGLGILFLIVAVLIVSGLDKKFSTYILDKGFLDITKVEEKILDKNNMHEDNFLERGENNEAANKTPDDNDYAESILFNANTPAPDLKGLTAWMNSAGYDSLDDLKGQVVIVDFWTYSCINCIRTLPYLQDWHEKYADDGLVILGIHAPEFAFEHKAENVANAISEYGLTYPVALDNDFATWRNYHNRYWPAKYIIDREGNIRYYHFGEGAYDETEEVIAALLGVSVKETSIESQRSGLTVKTPETYLGTGRRQNFTKKDSDDLVLNEWSLSGDWSADKEKVITNDVGAALSLRFYASEANLVMDGNARVQVSLDGKVTQTIEVNQATLYNLFKSGESGNHVVTLELLEGNVEAFAFTFG